MTRLTRWTRRNALFLTVVLWLFGMFVAALYALEETL